MQKNKNEMDLKEWVEGLPKNGNILAHNLLMKLLDIETIHRYLNAMYGVKLNITVSPVEKEEGMFYGKGLIDIL